MNSFHYKQLIRTLGILLLLCLAFGWWQNTHGTLGGAISVVKVMWLYLALACFFVVPFHLWRDRSLSDNAQCLWAWFFFGFALRALIELPMLLFTRAWRCGYGIAHDAVMLALLGVLGRRLDQSDCASRRFVPVLCAMLVFEMLNAKLFCMVAMPERGIYFASGQQAFDLINFITWGELAIAIPAFGWWLIWHGRTT